MSACIRFVIQMCQTLQQKNRLFLLSRQPIILKDPAHCCSETNSGLGTKASCTRDKTTWPTDRVKACLAKLRTRGHLKQFQSKGNGREGK